MAPALSVVSLEMLIQVSKSKFARIVLCTDTQAGKLVYQYEAARCWRSWLGELCERLSEWEM